MNLIINNITWLAKHWPLGSGVLSRYAVLSMVECTDINRWKVLNKIWMRCIFPRGWDACGCLSYFMLWKQSCIIIHSSQLKVESEDVCIAYWLFSAHSCIQSSCWQTGSSWKLSSSSCWMYRWARSNSSVKSGTWFSAARVTRKRWYEWNQFAKNAE